MARKPADIPKNEKSSAIQKISNFDLRGNLLHWGNGPLHLPLAWHTMVCFCVGSIQLVSGQRNSNFSPALKGLRFSHEMESFVIVPKAGSPGKGHRAAQPKIVKVEKITNLNRNMFLSQSHDFEWRDLILKKIGSLMRQLSRWKFHNMWFIHRKIQNWRHSSVVSLIFTSADK